MSIPRVILLIGLSLFVSLLGRPTWAWEGRFDIPLLCQQVGEQGVWDLADFGGSEKLFPWDTLQSGSTSEVATAVTHFCEIKNIPTCLQFAPWTMLNSPRIPVRLEAHERQLGLAAKFLLTRGFGGSEIAAELSQSVSGSTQYSPAAISQVRAVLATAAEFPDFRKKFEVARPLAPVLCAPFLDIDCVPALQDALTIGEVGRLKSEALITMMPAIDRLFTDPAHLKGAPLAALIIQRKLEDATHGIAPTGDLFSDLVGAYVDSGNSEARAADLAFDFLAFYGTRGASMDYASELANAENYPVMLAEYVISSAMGALDAMTLAGGHPYSYPPSIQTNCSYGRPYHFWMAAALAHDLVKRHHNPLSAFRAAHLTGVGYEALANTDTRMNWATLTLEPDDYANNGIRTNIAFDDAGAHFGAEFTAGRHLRPINVDSRLTVLYTQAKWEAKLSESDAKNLYKNSLPGYLLRWWDLFAPDAGLEAWNP
jgi:hypothetical protein